MVIVRYLQSGAEHETEFMGTEAEARSFLAKEGKVVIGIKKPSPFTFKRSAREDEVVAVFTALGDLLASGKNLTHAFNDIIPSLSKSSNLVPMLRRIQELVGQGRPLSQGLTEYKQVFGPTVIGMVVAGENAGKLPETLATMAEHVMQMAEMKKEMVKKMVMPAVMFSFGILSLFSNAKFVMPRLLAGQAKGAGHASVYLSLMKTLSVVIPAGIGIVVALVIAGVILFKLYQEELEKYLVRVPVLRDFIFYRSYFVAFSSLANLLSVNVAPVTAFGIIANSANFYTVKKQFEAAIVQLKAGAGFSGVADALTSLSSVEKGMLQAAVSVDRIEFICKRISKRYYGLYMARMQSLGPKVYVAVSTMVVGIIILMFLGVVLPYMKMSGAGVHP
ncbi:type II secretion system F family protein [Geomonas subterranea]|uniref:type II secretion system F family protein n=1 Tax=Geomonas subterranea TaxID=2847989 RepID=UPI001CD3CF46|nr:type II secretion system F family protein [Geomonas fuzhouensis]